MDYEILKKEIGSGPLSAGFTDKSDDFIANALNFPYDMAVKSRFITARSMLAELPNAADILDKLEEASAQISSIKWAMRFLSGETGIDIGHPNTILQIDALAGAGILTTVEASALKNMALQPVSRAEVIGVDTVTYNDVNKARAL